MYRSSVKLALELVRKSTKTPKAVSDNDYTQLVLTQWRVLSHLIRYFGRNDLSQMSRAGSFVLRRLVLAKAEQDDDAVVTDESYKKNDEEAEQDADAHKHSFLVDLLA